MGGFLSVVVLGRGVGRAIEWTCIGKMPTNTVRARDSAICMSSRTQTIPSRSPESILEPTSIAPVRVELLSQPRFLGGARDLVSAIAKRCGFDDNTCGQIALAVDEALCNVIRHGYERMADGRIWLNVWPLEEAGGEPFGIRIEIQDEAKQVDPQGIKGRDLDDVRPGGLGVYIMNQIMDAVRYEKRERVGMRLVMVKTHGGK